MMQNTPHTIPGLVACVWVRTFGTTLPVLKGLGVVTVGSRRLWTGPSRCIAVNPATGTMSSRLTFSHLQYHSLMVLPRSYLRTLIGAVIVNIASGPGGTDFAAERNSEFWQPCLITRKALRPQRYLDQNHSSPT